MVLVVESGLFADKAAAGTLFDDVRAELPYTGGANDLTGKAREAGMLIRGFDKKNPNHPDIPRAYLVGAQIMAEYAKKPDEAKRILEHLVKHYASDPVGTEAARYLEVMRRMSK